MILSDSKIFNDTVPLKVDQGQPSLATAPWLEDTRTLIR